MNAFVLLICINPNFFGCDVVSRDYFASREECHASLETAKIRPTDVAFCEYDPEHKK